MKITRTQLRQVIREEVAKATSKRTINEAPDVYKQFDMAFSTFAHDMNVLLENSSDDDIDDTANALIKMQSSWTSLIKLANKVK